MPAVEPPRPTPVGAVGALDLFRLPLLGRALRSGATRLAAQALLLLVATVLVLHGLFGPPLAPKNLATLLTWVHYRGALVLVLVVAGNFFCYACPMVLVRDLARRLRAPSWNWPVALRNKWLAVALFVLMLFAYERFSLWESPPLTAGLILGYFLAAAGVDVLYKHASFCKWVCPIGQFNFVASLLAPLEVRFRDPAVCGACRTKDCIRGRPEPGPEAGRRVALPLAARGCELALFQPRKVGNMDCTFCMDCVHACPHDNVGLFTRVPGEELVEGPQRSGLGAFFLRADLAALVVVFTFGALLNAFGMVRPVYALQLWLSRQLGTTSPTLILGLIFVAGLVVLPAGLLGGCGWMAHRLGGSDEPLGAHITRRCFALAPLGLGAWLAHYSFHFLTGVLTVVPVTQYALARAGWPALGAPRWDLGGLPEASVYPLELGMISLGLLGSVLVAYRQAVQGPGRCWSVAPWASLCALLWAAALWLLSQPMEMRGTFLGG